MECMHCKHKEDDAALECSRCGFNFKKWKDGPKGAAAPPRDAHDGSHHLWLGVFVLTAAAAGWYIHGLKADTGEVSLAKSLRPADAVAAPKDSWRFQGTVTDFLRGGPIKGVRVAFVDFETGAALEDATDDEGHFRIDVPIRWRLGYAVELTHNLYTKRYWTGAALGMGRVDRLKMGLDPAPDVPDTRVYRGPKSGAGPALDLALFPQFLTDEERQEASSL